MYLYLYLYLYLYRRGRLTLPKTWCFRGGGLCKKRVNGGVRLGRAAPQCAP